MPRIPAGGPKRMPPGAKPEQKQPAAAKPELKRPQPPPREAVPLPKVPPTALDAVHADPPDAWFDRLLVTLTQIAATDADIEGEVISELAEVRVPGDLMRLGLPAANIVRGLLKNERDARAAYT